jgi:anaerobic selenocysteine-containing dehydrogenase
MCGLVVDTDDAGNVARITGDDDDVLSHGFLCPKAYALKELHEDPDRLRRPIRRHGGAWVEIGWDEALALAAERLADIRERDGRGAVGYYAGNPTAHNTGALVGTLLMHAALDTEARFSASTVDQLPKQVANWLLWGNQYLFAVPDVDRTDLMVVLGANPVVSNGSIMSAPGMPRRLRALRRRGGRLIVIDPRRTETAALADEHHFIRPGSDALLLAALARTLLDDALGPAAPGAARAATGRAHASRLVGKERLRALLEPFAPERVAAATGIDAGVMRGLAAALAATERAVLYGRIGTCTQPFGTLSSWLVDVVNLLAGNVDAEGGAMFPQPAVDVVRLAPRLGLAGGRGRWRSRVRGAPEAMGELPASVLAEEIATPGAGRMRALVTTAGNPVLSTPAGHRLAAALPSLEFMVSVDLYLNETTRHAHLILPPCSPLEQGHYDLALHAVAVRNTARWSAPVFTAPADAPGDWEILSRLAVGVAQRRGRRGLALALRGLRALGLERALDLGLRAGPYGRGVRGGLSMRRLREAPHGVDLGPLQPCLDGRIATPGGRIDLAPALMVDEVARLRGVLAAAAAAPSAPGLVLVGRRHLRTNNSWLHNAPSLVKGPDRCVLLVNPRDAAAHGIADGAAVRVTSRTGTLVAPAQVTDEVMPGVVSLPHGWGHDAPGARLSVAARHAGVSANLLTDPEALDPPSGTAVLSGVPVQIEAVPAERAVAP